MIVSRSKSNSSMERPSGRTTGWAAFDRKQREKQGLSSPPECETDQFPPISDAKITNSKEVLLEKTFAFVAHPSHGSDIDSGAKYTVNNSKDVNCVEASIRRLKDVNKWADLAIIEDVLAAAKNDENHAMSLLKAMVSTDTVREKTSTSEVTINRKDSPFQNENSINNLVEELKTPVGSEKAEHEAVDGDKKIIQLSELFSVPVEPEWVEDDVYLSQRKDATKMMRLASQHSQAAKNAYLRGDHSSAQLLSQKARGEWMAAEELNNKAAKEILRIRNSDNNIWKLDLHGLHASEAVSALNDHLTKIESHFLMTHSASSLQSLNGEEVDAEVKQKKATNFQRPHQVHVITGVGNHSRGQAAIPAAVKSFLIDKGYRFDEARPGVIAVRPKFRY